MPRFGTFRRTGRPSARCAGRMAMRPVQSPLRPNLEAPTGAHVAPEQEDTPAEQLEAASAVPEGPAVRLSVTEACITPVLSRAAAQPLRDAQERCHHVRCVIPSDHRASNRSRGRDWSTGKNLAEDIVVPRDTLPVKS